MANSAQVLDKIKRNLDSVGVAATRTNSSVTAAGLTITYVPAALDQPMGGVNGDSSPYLGIGVANPGLIKIKAAAADNTIDLVFDTVGKVTVLACCARFANDVVIEAGDTTAELARLAGHPDLRMMGQ